MKNKTFRLLGLSSVFAFTLAIGMTSCKKDKDDNSASSKLSATVGTAAFTPQVVTAMSFSGQIWIAGYSAKSGGDSSVLQVSFPESATVNTGIDITSITADLSYWNTKQTIDYSSGYKSHGTITLTTFDKTGKKVAGNFNGVIYQSTNDSLVIKDGKFNTTYIAY